MTTNSYIKSYTASPNLFNSRSYKGFPSLSKSYKITTKSYKPSPHLFHRKSCKIFSRILYTYTYMHEYKTRSLECRSLSLSVLPYHHKSRTYIGYVWDFYIAAIILFIKRSHMYTISRCNRAPLCAYQ